MENAIIYKFETEPAWLGFLRGMAITGFVIYGSPQRDDANVGKFTNMIREFSENSQFIIVTHNKMTMSAVDVIYGVTMQEPGVSKLVPVDFRSLN